MLKITDLRKIYSAQGVKGFSSANREAFNADIAAAEVEAYAEDAARTPAPVVEVAPVAPVARSAKKGCEFCGRKIAKGHDSLCEICFDYAGWENTHSDDSHEMEIGEDWTEGEKAKFNEFREGCPICHPELDRRTPKGTGKSRAGMVIVAKGSEIHKSATFAAAAEAAGWKVEILGSVVTEEDGEEIERYVAIANRDGNVIELAWNGRAYDYPGSSAHLGGKSRKVRNLKEALRLLAA